MIDNFKKIGGYYFDRKLGIVGFYKTLNEQIMYLCIFIVLRWFILLYCETVFSSSFFYVRIFYSGVRKFLMVFC